MAKACMTVMGALKSNEKCVLATLPNNINTSLGCLSLTNKKFFFDAVVVVVIVVVVVVVVIERE